MSIKTTHFILCILFSLITGVFFGRAFPPKEKTNPKTAISSIINESSKEVVDSAKQESDSNTDSTNSTPERIDTPNSIQVRLPALKQNAGYKYPQYKSDRSSRQIADWYYRSNNLLIVEDYLFLATGVSTG